MRNSALQERRNRQILADIVRAYIETGEPVSSRAISKGFEESLSTATIRNVMADLEDAGFLYQPHTSAGRVPTAAAYPFAIDGGDGGLRGNLLGKKSIRRGGWHAPGRGMRLVQKPGILQVSHDVADRSRAQRLFKAFGYGARGYWFTGFDVHAHDIRQDL